ncbi:MAG: hypothetical protein AABX01_05750 [Candidatus Micrarchaeota archaeon]
MADITDRIWEMEGGKPKTWWWWFWLFYIDNPKDPKKPRQLMILWSVKREKHILCNDVLLDMDGDVVNEGGKISFKGATASWFFDGNSMHEDFLVAPSNITINGNGKRNLDAEKSKFAQKGKEFRVFIDGRQAQVDFKCRMLPNTPPIHKDHNFLGTLGYDILKINRLSLTGTIKQKGKIEKISGTAYFQKVFVTGPVIPWQWGLVHFENGSILSYNIGRIGESFFAERNSPLDLKLRRKLEFYDSKTRKHYLFGDVRIHRTKGDLPAFILEAKNNAAGGQNLKITLQSYSRALWRLQKSRRHALNTLYYHEFCVNADDFSFTTGGKTISLGEVGEGVGNCEDSKGMLV